MNTLICAGGSATRVLEAVLHLCAAGLGPDKLRLLRIDPDQSNGNASRVKGLLDTYNALHAACRGRLGPYKLFHTELESFDTWSPVPPGATLGKVLNFDVLPTLQQDVSRLFFTDVERELNLDQGFRGHTAIGAAAMALVSQAANEPPWDELTAKLRGDLDGPGARVFLAASVFGGTGASAIHPISRFLRSVPERNPGQLKIGVAALLPYFKFKPIGKDNPELAARAEDFALATKAATSFYQHLRENKDWDFDAMYWIGDSGPTRDMPYAAGGAEQRNPAHFVDLLAALCGVEFFLSPPTDRGSPCYFSGPRRDVEPTLEENLLDWADLPLRHLDRKVVKRALWRLFLSGVVHVGFYKDLLRGDRLRARPHVLPWYYRYFHGQTGEGALGSSKEQEVMERLSDFFDSYHLPFWGQMLESRQVRLFNKEAIPPKDGPGGLGAERRQADLRRLHNLLWPDRGIYRDQDSMDAFFDDMIEVGRPRGTGGAAAYLSLLTSAAERYMNRQVGA